MAMTVLQTRVDLETKLAAENLFSSLGLDITTAIRLFLKQAINQQKISFDIIPPKKPFSAEVLATINEAKKNSRDPNVKSYSSAKALFENCE